MGFGLVIGFTELLQIVTTSKGSIHFTIHLGMRFGTPNLQSSPVLR
jgi:hypothetical protein